MVWGEEERKRKEKKGSNEWGFERVCTNLINIYIYFIFYVGATILYIQFDTNAM